LLTAVSDKRYTVGQIGTPGAGPFMTIVLTLSGDQVVEAKFSTYPCPAANACGDFITNWIEGKRLADIERMTIQLLLAGTGPMPLGREHCPVLAVNALKDALVRLHKLDADENGDTSEAGT
jgi:NifU-like protein involved in Fe-S cluster formation